MGNLSSLPPERTHHLSPIFTWRSAVSSPLGPESPTTRHVLLALSLYMNERGGSAFPGTAQLAIDTGLSEETCRVHLRRAVDGDWLRQEATGGGAGHTNRYAACYPQALAAYEKPPTSLGPTPNVTRKNPQGGWGEQVINKPVKRAPSDPLESQSLAAASQRDINRLRRAHPHARCGGTGSYEVLTDTTSAVEPCSDCRATGVDPEFLP